MKTPKAIEVIQEHQRHIATQNKAIHNRVDMPDAVELDKALSKAVEVMNEKQSEKASKELSESYKPQYEVVGTSASEEPPTPTMCKDAIKKFSNKFNGKLEVWLKNTITKHIPTFQLPITAYSMWQYGVTIHRKPLTGGSYVYTIKKNGEQIGSQFIEKFEVTND